MAPFRTLLLPLATLVTTALAYSVLLLVCEPFLNKAAKGIYRWAFILGIVGSVGWLLFAWIRKCVPLLADMDSRRMQKAVATLVCRLCNRGAAVAHHCKRLKPTRFSAQYGSSPFRLHKTHNGLHGGSDQSIG